MISEWKDGLPPKSASGAFLGKSKDGRLWLLQFMFNRDVMAWAASGFNREGFHPEFRLLKEENAGFITSHREIHV